MTLVVNLLGGSGIGKTTLSTGLFYKFKCQGKNIELVREYVKAWAWEGKKVGQYDQPYLFGKQLKLETSLYGKVDYIVTDSPLILSPIYEMFYNNGQSLVDDACLKHIQKAEKNGIRFLNFMVNRTKPFKTEGRYEDEATARKFDLFLKDKLEELNIGYIGLTSTTEDDKVLEIINYINILEHKVSL